MIFDFLSKNKKGKIRPLFNLQLDLTYNCNLQCRHCYQGYNRKKNNELNIDDWESIIGQYARLAKKIDVGRVITISGGEPLLYPRIRELLTFLHNDKEIIDIYLLTNGTLIDVAAAEFLSKLRVKVQISLDGPTADTNDYIRGKKSFCGAINGALILQKYNIPFSFQAVLQKSIEYLIPHFFSLAKKQSAMSMNFVRYVTPHDKLHIKSNDEVMIKGNDLKRIFENILELSRLHNISTNTDQPLWCLIDPSLGHPSSAGFLGLTIDPRGKIQITSRICETIGDARKQNGLIETYFNNKLLHKLRNGEIDGCNKCRYFTKCRGDRSISYVIHGNFFGPDEHCWYWQNHIK